jgi:hypothetical protein
MREFLDGLAVFLQAIITVTIIINWWDGRKNRQTLKVVKKEVDEIRSVVVNGTTDYPPDRLN